MRNNFKSFREARTTGGLSRKKARKLFPRSGFGKILGLYDLVVDSQVDAFDAAGKAIGLGKVGTKIFDVEKKIINAPGKGLDKTAGFVLGNENKFKAVRVLTDVAGIGLVAAGGMAVLSGLEPEVGASLVKTGGTILLAGKATQVVLDSAKQVKQVETAVNVLSGVEGAGKVGVSKFSVFRTAALKDVAKQEKVDELIDTVKERTGVSLGVGEARDLIFGSEDLDEVEQRAALRELESFIKTIEKTNEINDVPLSPEQARLVLSQRKIVIENKKRVELETELDFIKMNLLNIELEEDDGILLNPLELKELKEILNSSNVSTSQAKKIVLERSRQRDIKGGKAFKKSAKSIKEEIKEINKKEEAEKRNRSPPPSPPPSPRQGPSPSPSPSPHPSPSLLDSPPPSPSPSPSQGPPIVSTITDKVIQDRRDSEAKLAELANLGLINTSQREDPRPSAKAPVDTIGLDINEDTEEIAQEDEPLSPLQEELAPIQEKTIEQRLIDAVNPINNEGMLGVINRKRLKSFGNQIGATKLSNKLVPQIVEKIKNEGNREILAENTLVNEFIQGLTDSENVKNWLHRNSKKLGKIKKINPQAFKEIHEISKDLIERNKK